MKKVLIGGGSGLVGSKLTDILMDRGYEVLHLSRSEEKNNWVRSIHWDVEKGELDPKEIEGVDYIINLAGAGIADEKWTEERLEVIKSSRVDSNLLLKETIKSLEKKPELFISASAIGYYGFETTDEIYTEEDEEGNDILAQICKEWEESADKVGELGIAVTKIRIGLVLSDEGGALPRIEEPIRWGVGAALGSGKQYMAWIHIDDLCNIFYHVLENNLSGTFNAVSPKAVTNKEFTQKLAEVMGKRLVLPNIPGFLIKLFMGKRADLLLEGSRVSSEKIRKTDFKFQYGKLDKALKDLCIDL